MALPHSKLLWSKIRLAEGRLNSASHRFWTHPSLAELLPVFLVFEVLFYGILQIFSERTHELFPFWAVITANTLAAICMGLYLWKRHPAFRQSIHDTPLGAAPQ